MNDYNIEICEEDENDNEVYFIDDLFNLMK